MLAQIDLWANTDTRCAAEHGFDLSGHAINSGADLDGEKLVNLRLVKKVAAPAKTVTATRSQDGNGTMRLIISNPFDKELRIQMGMMPLDSGSLLAPSPPEIPALCT